MREGGMHRSLGNEAREDRGRGWSDVAVRHGGLEPPGAGSSRKEHALELRRNLADTLTLDFWPPDCEIMNFWCLNQFMTNLGNVLKSKDITLLTKVHTVKAMVFPVVMYGC